MLLKNLQSCLELMGYLPKIDGLNGFSEIFSANNINVTIIRGFNVVSTPCRYCIYILNDENVVLTITRLHGKQLFMDYHWSSDGNIEYPITLIEYVILLDEEFR